MCIKAGKKVEEKSIRLSTLKPGDVFRLPGITFEQAIAGDDGINFYTVKGNKKEGLMVVFSTDSPDKERKLPEETEVIQHKWELQIFPNTGTLYKKHGV